MGPLPTPCARQDLRVSGAGPRALLRAWRAAGAQGTSQSAQDLDTPGSEYFIPKVTSRYFVL